MASTTAMNTWLEELALSIIPPATKQSEIRRNKDIFVRRAKNHSYARTNQFAVTEKLTGLEEKLQVLGLDDVATELFAHRSELKRHHDDKSKWLPDVVDLLLHLSHDPVRHSRVENLERYNPEVELLRAMRSENIQAEGIFDRGDAIWEVPQYSDFSSDEDEADLGSSSQTSPGFTKQRPGHALDPKKLFDEPASDLAADLHAAQFWQPSKQEITITETQAIREVLFSLNGLPTSTFTRSGHGIVPNKQYRIYPLDTATSFSLLMEGARLASAMDVVRQWLRRPQNSNVMQLMQSKISNVLVNFDKAISEEHNQILRQLSPAGVVSLLQVLSRVKKFSLPLHAIKTTICQPMPTNAVSILDDMFDRLNSAQSSDNPTEPGVILSIFLPAFELYAKAIDTWMCTGEIQQEAFFVVERTKAMRDPGTLWHDCFFLASDGAASIPSFLTRFALQIFTMGKTAAFLKLLDRSFINSHHGDLGITAATKEAVDLAAGVQVSFAATFELVLERHLANMLESATEKLKHVLETSCGLTRLLDAFDHLYLAKNGVVINTIESKAFDQIDRCIDIWNDQFLITDMLAEAYCDIDCVDVGAMTIQTAYTSSRMMESRRRSVKILSAISYTYHVPWPLANVISPGSIASYQRIALTLAQIRRAKYSLERRACFYLQHMALTFDDPSHAKRTRLVLWQLSVFVRALYTHLTDCVMRPVTTSMRIQLCSTTTGSLDDMISVYRQYITVLEHACLSDKRTKPLRDALISILDLCIRFADSITSAATNSNILVPSRDTNEGDFEASSFISAQSRRKRRRGKETENEVSSSSDEDDNDNDGYGEGYSTFNTDENTSLMQESLKITSDFKRHLDFLIAGLRAIARSSTSTPSTATPIYEAEFEVGETFELLADTLAGIFPTRERLAF